MLFNTPAYFFFLAITLVLYFSLRHRAQNVMLLGTSYVFYGNWDVRFLALLLLSTVIDFCAGIWIQRGRERQDQQLMRRVLVASLGSQQANRHVHWHVAPLPPGVPLEDQQLAAFAWEPKGVLEIPDEELGALAQRLREALT